MWLRDYRKDWLRPDVLAGLATAAVVIPKAMAYATIAGLPVQIGLYTAFVPMAIYAVLGSSRPLSVSTTTTIAILTAAALAEAVPSGNAVELATATAALSIMAGAMLAVAGVLRLGFIANFISEPVLTGFKSGIGLVIVIDQIPKLLGVHIDKGGFFQNILSTVMHLPETHLLTAAVALGVIVVIFGLEHAVPHSPAGLVAVAAAIAVSALFALDQHGVATVGEVPRGLPSLVLPPLALLAKVWPGAAAIALMSFTESIAAARAFSAPGETLPAPNQELLALGAANAGGGFFGALPAGGGTSQTAVNRKAGARTQMAELVTATGSLATLLFLAPVIGRLPQAALAAVVVMYSFELIKPSEFLAIRRVRRIEFHWALVAVAGVALLGTLKGIVVAVVMSLLSIAHQAYNPPVYVIGRKRGTAVLRPRSLEHPDDESWPGLLIVRPEGRMFFANAPQISENFRVLIAEAHPKVVVLDLRAVPDLEYTALKMLTEAEARLRADGIMLWLAALNPEVLAVIQRSSLGALLGRERMFFKLAQAVDQYERMTAGTAPGR